MMKRWRDNLLRWLPIYRALILERNRAIDAHMAAESAVADLRRQALEASRIVVELAREKDDILKRWIDWQAVVARHPTVFHPPGEYPSAPQSEALAFSNRRPTAQALVDEAERTFEEQLAEYARQALAEHEHVG